MYGGARAEKQRIRQETPERIRQEWEDHTLRRCWIEWEQVEDLALADAVGEYEHLRQFASGGIRKCTVRRHDRWIQPAPWDLSVS